MRRDQHGPCLWTLAVMLSLFLSGYFVPMLGAQTVQGCLTKSGTIKRINRPCKKKQQSVILPLAETVDQLQEGIAEFAGVKHEIPFHATIHAGEEAVLIDRFGMRFVAQVTGVVTAIRRTDENGFPLVEAAKYRVNLKLLNTGDTDLLYAGSGGTLKSRESIDFAQWEVDDNLTLGHPDKDLVTAYKAETGAHLQLEMSKMMLIAKPTEDAVIVAGAVRAIDPESFAVESRPIAE